MKYIVGAFLALSITGCSLTGQVPSFYDDNESKAIVDVQVAVKTLECSTDNTEQQIENVLYRTEWLNTYANSKGSTDVLEVLAVFKKSLDGLKDKGQKSFVCNMKKKTLIKQSNDIAKAIMGRY
jgi:hypothetical protein